MASFPGAIKAFVARVVDDFILVAHVNDLQDEVTAIETALGVNSLTLMARIWPIGSIFMAVVSTNPATLLGFGTWSAWAAGRVPVGRDAGQTEFDVVEETGGAKTHTLQTTEIPAHNHTMSTALFSGAAGGGNALNTGQGTLAYTINNTGGGGAHNNLQPYIVCYMWKRTA